jgi:hypothetical protein
MSNETTLPESTYPPLEKPVLTSDIPEMLYKNSSEAEKYILNQLSINKQFIAWSIEAQLSTHAAVRRTNGRVIALESWKDKITSIVSSWWGLCGAILTLIGGIAGVVQIVESFKDHLTK